MKAIIILSVLVIMLGSGCKKAYVCQCTTYDKTDGYRAYPSDPIGITALPNDATTDCMAKEHPESTSYVEKCYIH